MPSMNLKEKNNYFKEIWNVETNVVNGKSTLTSKIDLEHIRKVEATLPQHFSKSQLEKIFV